MVQHALVALQVNSLCEQKRHLRTNCLRLTSLYLHSYVDICRLEYQHFHFRHKSNLIAQTTAMPQYSRTEHVYRRLVLMEIFFILLICNDKKPYVRVEKQIDALLYQDHF